MFELMNDPQRCAAAGRANRQFWRRELTPERYIQRYEAFLRSLPGKHAARGRRAA
jgi:hypothetical protein